LITTRAASIPKSMASPFVTLPNIGQNRREKPAFFKIFHSIPMRY
jgi:hypothetical protein